MIADCATGRNTGIDREALQREVVLSATRAALEQMARGLIERGQIAVNGQRSTVDGGEGTVNGQRSTVDGLNEKEVDECGTC